MPASTASTPLASPVDLLVSIPLFSSVPQDLLEKTAALLTERSFSPGEVIVTEGERGDSVFFIAEGFAEVTTLTPSGALLLDTLAFGDYFGELALTFSDATRRATVTATTRLRTLVLERTPFAELRHAVPDLDHALASSSDLLLVAKALKIAAPFTRVEISRLKEIAARVERLSATAGEEIIREGESGDTCYLIIGGEAEVLVGNGPAARTVATLSVGAVFGEAALLTRTTRNATVRAKGNMQLLSIHRPVVMEVLSEHHEVLRALTELLLMRARPKRRTGIEVHQRVNETGEPVITLKDPAHCRYYRLSAEGLFVWEQLDGNSTIRDIVLASLLRFKKFFPQTVCTVISGLTAAGFTEITQYHRDVKDLMGEESGHSPALNLLRHLVEKRFLFSGADPAVTFLSRLCEPLMTLPGTLLLGVSVIAGMIYFPLALHRVTPHDLQDSATIVISLSLTAVAVVVHEVAHACTARHLGYRIDRFGVGWFWLLPVAFVDTSDTWVGTKRERMLVTAAGPWSTLVIGSLAVLAAPFASHQPALVLFAAVSYLLVLANLNPLVELDGYYLLSDHLDEPRLRVKALEQIMSRWGEDRKVLPLTDSTRTYLVASALFAAVVTLLILCGVGYAGGKRVW